MGDHVYTYLEVSGEDFFEVRGLRANYSHMDFETGIWALDLRIGKFASLSKPSDCQEKLQSTAPSEIYLVSTFCWSEAAI